MSTAGTAATGAASNGSMATGILADEVCSLVIDLGTRFLRVGYSGDERPSVVISSLVVVSEEEQDQAGRVRFGELALNSAASLGQNVQIIPTMNVNGASDFALVEALLQHVVTDMMGASWTEHPILLVDSPAWDKDMREAFVTLFFEKFNVPAVFLGRSPVLSSFCISKNTALVVDLGHGSVKIAPVYEGYLIRGGIVVNTKFGGLALDSLMSQLVCDPTNLTPRYLVSSRQSVPLGQPPVFELVKDHPDSTAMQVEMDGDIKTWTPREYQHMLLLEDFKESVLEVAESSPFNERDLCVRPPRYFEFPTGYNMNFGIDRFRLSEKIFVDGNRSDSSSINSNSGLISLIRTSLQGCDAEMRSAIMNNVVVTGGGACMSGLVDRINFELQSQLTSAYGRIKVSATGSSIAERRFGPWIGGSILSSLGSFNQMWLTKAEFNEHGASYIDRKCP